MHDIFSNNYVLPGMHAPSPANYVMPYIRDTSSIMSFWRPSEAHSSACIIRTVYSYAAAALPCIQYLLVWPEAT